MRPATTPRTDLERVRILPFNRLGNVVIQLEWVAMVLLFWRQRERLVSLMVGGLPKIHEHRTFIFNSYRKIFV